ncbi:cell division protein FtsL [Paracoccaceae bacterium Fryx2]|nr:cell division protein FtsL [Paracoccaceae bacterium Fryx2]
MRPVMYILTFLAVMGLAFWAYRENYATQQALKEVSSLQGQIAGLREALSVQRAEWAYLNRPARLRELTTINFDRLRLLPLEPEQFGQAALLAYPAPALPEISETVDLSGDQEAFP